MLDETEIKRWIARLETEESSWSNYEKLAVLYALQNQHAPEPSAPEPMMYSAASAKVYGDSDFLRAVADVPPDKAWEIIDELMDDLKIVNERVYNSVMRKLEK